MTGLHRDEPSELAPRNGTSDKRQHAANRSGVGEKKWRLIRRALRAEAAQRNIPVVYLYAAHGVLTAREAESLNNPPSQERLDMRAEWRARKSAKRTRMLSRTN